MSAEYLESMRDCGDIALFWDGYRAGNGWNLFEGTSHVIQWFTWLISKEQLEQFGIAEKDADELRPLLDAVESASLGDSSDDEERFLDRANEFIWKYEEVQWGKYDASGHRFLNYNRLVTNPEFIEEFAEYLEESGLPESSPEESLEEFEEMLGRFQGPGSWTPP